MTGITTPGGVRALRIEDEGATNHLLPTERVADVREGGTFITRGGTCGDTTAECR